MIPVEFSYLRTIFGKSGQGSAFTRLPLKCRELLSYLSVHFFMDTDEQMVMKRIMPAFIPAGNTVMWEFERELEDDFSEYQSEGISTYASNKTSKLIFISKIKRNIILTCYSGEVEIEDREVDTDKIGAYQLSHLLMIGMDSPDAAEDHWIYTDPMADPVAGISQESGTDYSKTDNKELKKRIFIRPVVVSCINRWMYFYSRPIPDPGIRAGPS